jgi:hypothetical protein
MLDLDIGARQMSTTYPDRETSGSAARGAFRSDEINTASGERPGDFPQAFSHTGLVTAAWESAEARGRVS